VAFLEVGKLPLVLVDGRNFQSDAGERDCVATFRSRTRTVVHGDADDDRVARLEAISLGDQVNAGAGR